MDPTTIAIVNDDDPTTNEYHRLLSKVRAGLDAYYELGISLTKIRDQELYLVEYETWSDFLENEVEVSVRRAHQMIAAAGVQHTLDRQVNEAQAAALEPVPEDERMDIIEVVEAQGKVTAAKIKQEAVRRATESMPDEEMPSPIMHNAEINDLAEQVQVIRRLVGTLPSNEYTRMVPRARIEDQLNGVYKALRGSVLSHPCPWCGAKPGGCNECSGTGHVNGLTWKHRPEAFK